MIRIGMTTPLTGPASESGQALSQGARFAVEEINAAEGVRLGKKQFKVMLFVEDCQSKPEVGLSVAEKLIVQDKVHYLIGDALHSSVTMAVMDLAPKYSIPIVSGESVSETIVEKVKADPDKYHYYWKMDFGSTAYAEAVFNALKGLVEKGMFQTGARRIFFIVEDTDYGRSNADSIAAQFEGAGWSVSSLEKVPLDYTGFDPQLSKLRDERADVLVSIFTSHASGSMLVRRFRELGLNALHVAIYYPGLPEFKQQVAEDEECLLWMPLDFDPQHVRTHREFSDKIQTKLHIEATYDHAFGYDAIYNAVDSFRRADSLNSEDVVDAVARLDRKGIIGRFVFDPGTHQVKAGAEFIPVFVAQIQSGKNQIVWPEQFATADYQPQPWVK